MLQQPVCSARLARGPVVKEEEEAEGTGESYNKAFKDSQLNELAEWPGLVVALAIGNVVVPEPEQEQPEPSPLAHLVGHLWSWTSMMPCTPKCVSCMPLWVGADQEQEGPWPPEQQQLDQL